MCTDFALRVALQYWWCCCLVQNCGVGRLFKNWQNGCSCSIYCYAKEPLMELTKIKKDLEEMVQVHFWIFLQFTLSMIMGSLQCSLFCLSGGSIQCSREQFLSELTLYKIVSITWSLWKVPSEYLSFGWKYLFLCWKDICHWGSIWWVNDHGRYGQLSADEEEHQMIGPTSSIIKKTKN